MPFNPTATGHNIGKFCLRLLDDLTPDASFEDRHEALRVRFAVGTVFVMFAKQITTATINPIFVQTMCDAIEDPFYSFVKNLDPDLSIVNVIEFLPDEAEQDLFCQDTRITKDKLANLGTDLSVIYGVLYPYREKLYYQDLQAADGVFNVLGDMVFVFKRLMLHVYGIKTNMRDKFLEEELFEKSPASFGLILRTSYDALCAHIVQQLQMALQTQGKKWWQFWK